MPTVTFYLLTTESTDNGLSPEEQLACDLASSLWQTNQQLLLACINESQAYRLIDGRIISFWQKRLNKPMIPSGNCL